MNNFLKKLILLVSFVLLNSCASPTKLDVILPNDTKLNCDELLEAFVETREFRKNTRQRHTRSEGTPLEGSRRESRNAESSQTIRGFRKSTQGRHRKSEECPFEGSSRARNYPACERLEFSYCGSERRA